MTTKKTPVKVNISAKTGQYVTEGYAKKHPSTTVNLTVQKPKPPKRK